MAQREVIQAKLVFLGEAAVGKSSLVLRFVKDEFNQNSESTIGAAFLTAQININDRQSVKYEIWDTAGQERFHSLAPMYYRGAQAAIVVYDITSMPSFERAKSWITELQVEGNADVVIALAGNKLDLDSSRVVSTELAETYANRHGLIFMECSAKSNVNVKEVFTEIARRLPSFKSSAPPKPSAQVQFKKQPPPQPSGGCCS